MKQRVADYIADFIESWGIEHVMLLTGGGVMHITDGLACNPNIKKVCFHHEQAAAMAVDAYARVSGKPGVGVFTTGCGATNTITGVAGAWLDSAPCLIIYGQAKKKETTYLCGIRNLRQIGVQEINILPMIESITKYSAMVTEPDDIKYHLEKAMHIATSGRPGPVWLDIPLDIQSAYVESETLEGYIPKIDVYNIGITSNIIAAMIEESNRPVILAGQGVRIAGAIDDLTAFSHKYNIPIVTTFLGIDIIDSKDSHYVGRVGIKGDRAGNWAINKSDLLLIMGSSMPVAQIGYDYDQFAPNAKKVVIDIDMTSHEKSAIKYDIKLEADLRTAIGKIWHGRSCDDEWRAKCIRIRAIFRYCVIYKSFNVFSITCTIVWDSVCCSYLL